MPKLTDEELLNIVDSEFSSAMGASGGEIARERAKAWDFYMSKPLGNEIEGQSQVVTSDVSDVVDGIMPSLLRIFTTADNLVNFDPVGPEDVEKAKQESDYVNYVFFKLNDAFSIMYTWFFDALVQKNGIIKAWWDESEAITTETYEGLDETELLELIQDEELEPVERSERAVDDGTGQEQVVHDIKFKRTSKGGRARVENVPPEEFRISSDARSLGTSTARMVGQEREMTRSELIDMGFDRDLVDSLPADGIKLDDEKTSRYDKAEERDDTVHDRSQEKILVREAYLKVDADGDGRSELLQIIAAGKRILEKEEVDRDPFHVISPQPLPHKHFGRASAEKVMDVQQINSTLLRQVLDNLYHTNNPGHAVWEQALTDNTLDDLLTTRVGRVARFGRPVAQSWAPMTIPFTAGATFPMIEYWDKVKRDRTGISNSMEGLDPDALKNIQTTVLAQANDLSKMKIEAVARIFAETGIKSLMLHIHELLLKHQKKEQVIRLRNEWVDINPQEWRTRIDMTANIGLGIGTREQNLLHLNAIWEKQRDIVSVEGLGNIVTPRNVYNTASELVRNANLKQPSMFFTETDQVAPRSGEQDQLLKIQAELQARQQELDAAENQLKAGKAQLEHQREMLELERKREADKDKLVIEFEKIATKLTELELVHSQNIPGAKI